jgi:CheY-like chemotaxis protein
MTPLKLLVVEDDPASLELMSEVFTSLKAEVRAVNDSEKAVGIINLPGLGNAQPAPWGASQPVLRIFSP